MEPNPLKRFEETIKGFPIEKRRRARLAFKRGLYRRSLFHFIKYGLGYSKLKWTVHGPICQALQDVYKGVSKRALIVVPRGCFKSTIGSVGFPMWCLINDPDMRILIDSELATNSEKFLNEIKGHMLTSEMIELFGEFRDKDRKWSANEIVIKQRKRIRKEASITCSGIGSQKTSQHYCTIIADDLSTPANSNTPESRSKVHNHFRMYTSLLDPHVGRAVVIGTRYSEGDIIGFVIENELEPNQRKALGF